MSRQEHKIILILCVCVGGGREGGAQSCPTLGDPMDCSLQSTQSMEFFQARILEWFAISYSRNFLLVLDFYLGQLLNLRSLLISWVIFPDCSNGNRLESFAFYDLMILTSSPFNSTFLPILSSTFY